MDNEDSDQTERICTLIWVSFVRTCQKVRFLTLRLFCAASVNKANSFYRYGMSQYISNTVYLSPDIYVLKSYRETAKFAVKQPEWHHVYITLH